MKCSAAIALTATFSMTFASLVERGATDPIKLTWVASGASTKFGVFEPQQLNLATEKPDGLSKLPLLVSPLYGQIVIGPAESRMSVAVVLDEPQGSPANLYIDANGDGDLTNDPIATWESRAYLAQDGTEFQMWAGGAFVQIDYGRFPELPARHQRIEENRLRSQRAQILSRLSDQSLSKQERDQLIDERYDIERRLIPAKPFPAYLGVYRLDKNDPEKVDFKDKLLYFSDYGYEGEAPIGDAFYPVMLIDDEARGDFTGRLTGEHSGVRLLVDINRNGKFDAVGEGFDVHKPFNIGGACWEILGLPPSGSVFQLSPSAVWVPEIEVVPNPESDHAPGTKPGR